MFFAVIGNKVEVCFFLKAFHVPIDFHKVHYTRGKGAGFTGWEGCSGTHLHVIVYTENIYVSSDLVLSQLQRKASQSSSVN